MAPSYLDENRHSSLIDMTHTLDRASFEIDGYIWSRVSLPQLPGATDPRQPRRQVQ